MKRQARAPYNNRPFKAPRRTNTNTIAKEVSKQLAKKDDYHQLQGRDIAATGIINTGYMLDLGTTFARGDNAINDFAGEKVFPKSLKIRLQWAATDTFNLMRVVIFQWFGPLVPAVTDILNTAGVAATQQALCYRQWSRHNQYKILHDSMHQLNNSSGFCGGVGPNLPLEVYVPGSKLQPIEFNVTTTAYQRGGLFMLTLSDSLAVPHPEQNAVWELIYTD